MKLEITGIEELIGQLEELADDADEMYKRAAYAGAKVLADEIKKGLNNLRVVKARWGTPENPLQGIPAERKADLIAGMGVSDIENDGTKTTVSVGFHGYGSRPTKTYPQGIPNQMLMRSVESGTSFMVKQPVVRPAVNRAKKQAEAAMEKEVTEYLAKKIK